VNEKSDHDLMLDLQNGHSQALDEIIHRWESPIKSYLYRYTQDPEWVEELAQETFVKVYLNAARFDLQRKFSPWIYTIASNLGKNLLRWQSRRPKATHSLDEIRENPGRDQGVYIDHSAQAPADQLCASEEVAQLQLAIAQLPDILKTTLLLYYYQKLSYEEIAEVLRCSIRGVETRLYRARKSLKEGLSSLDSKAVRQTHASM
jgi:RNA polymerase sigma-70 factor, ECF subfamily